MSDEHAGALLEVIEILPDHELAALDHDYLVGNRVEIAGRTRRENEEPAGAPTRRGLRCQGTDFLVEALARRLIERSLNLIEERDGRARCERDRTHEDGDLSSGEPTHGLPMQEHRAELESLKILVKEPLIPLGAQLGVLHEGAPKEFTEVLGG